MIFRMCLMLVSAVLSSAVLAQDKPDPLGWEISFKVGQLQSALEQWDDHYLDSPVMLSAGFAYKLTRGLALGIEVGRSRVEGKGYLPLNQTTGGDVTFTQSPVNVMLTYRLVLNENQHWVPYVGAGVGKMYYRQEVSSQPDVEGSVGSQHYKLGLQYLLDGLDKSSAVEAKNRHGLDNTYFFLEYMDISAEQNDTAFDLGGEVISIGVLMEM